VPENILVKKVKTKNNFFFVGLKIYLCTGKNANGHQYGHPVKLAQNGKH
jgi:hypothetical protein